MSDSPPRGSIPVVERPRAERLDSWKEIASYLRRDVKTVQRWEKREGMPVHRHRHDKLGSVYAFRSDLDAWARSRSFGAEPDGSAPWGRPDVTEHGSSGTDVPLGSGTERVRSVAVIPFSVDPPEADSAQLGEGVSERILNALIRVPELKVLARASSFRYGADRPDLREVGKLLGVDYIVEGAIKRAGERRRVSVQLVEAATGFVRWADTFERPSPELASVDEAVVRGIAQALGLEPPAPRPVPRSPDPFAIEKVMQARFYWNRRPGTGVVELAIQCYREAIEADPACAEAWSGLAEVYATLGSWESGVLPHAEAQSKASTCAARALSIDPTLADAHAALAYSALHYGWDSAAADASFRRAIALNRNCVTAFHWYSHALVAVGQFEESLAHSRAALQLDPMNLLIHVHLAWHHYMAREPGKTVEQAENVIRMDPTYHKGFELLAWGLEAEGRLAEAVDAARESVRLSDGHPVMVAGLGRALASAGDVRAARETAARLAPDERGRDLFAYELAMIHLALGETEAAFERLDRALECRSGWIAYAHVHPRLDPIRGQRRLQPILAAAPRALSPVHPPAG